MNRTAQVGQWYTQLDTKETFLVTGYDDKSRSIETQAINGDLDEIDEGDWYTVPLALAEPPEDWTETINDGDVPNAESLIAPIDKSLLA